MANCCLFQIRLTFFSPNRLLNQKEKFLKLMTKEVILTNAIMMMFVKKRQVKVLPQGPLMGHQMQKGNMYLNQRVEKNLEDKLSFLTEMKETMNTINTSLGYFL